MASEDKKEDFKPYRQFSNVDPSFTGITYRDLAKPQGLSEDQIADVSQTLTTVNVLGVGTATPTTTLEAMSQTSPQFKISYDTTHYLTEGVDSAGVATFTSSANEIRFSYLTQGSVLFAGPSGFITQDNANFFWDDTNNRLGIGCNDPWRTLEVRHVSLPQVVLSTDDNNATLFQGSGNGMVVTGYTTVWGGLPFFSVQCDVNAIVAEMSIYNTHSSGNSGAKMLVKVESGSTGDPYYQLYNGVVIWTFGLDNDDSDKFKLSKSATLGTTDYLTVDTSGNFLLTAAAQSSGKPSVFRINAPAHTSVNTEAIDIYFNLTRTVTFSGGIADNRAFVIGAPTYASTAPGTMSNAYTVVIEGAPSAGTNMTISNAWAFYVQTGASYFGGSVSFGSFTAGSVLFAGSSGLISQDNSNFFWDDTNNKLLLGSGSATHPAYSFGSFTSTGMHLDGSGRILFSIAGTDNFNIQGTRVSIGSTTEIGWESGASPGLAVPDVRLFRDAANALGLRNGTNAQTFSVYNTYTAGTPDYERLDLTWSANVAKIGTSKSGTGSFRSMNLLYGDAANAFVIPAQNSNSAIVVGTGTANAFTGGVMAFSASYTRLTSTNYILGLINSFSDGGTTSSCAWYSLNISPTVNYTAASKTGKLNLIYLNPTLTSLPTGNNAGLVFSSAFTNSSFGPLRIYNSSDEDTNTEFFQMGFHLVANTFAIRVDNQGIGTGRDLTFYFRNSTTNKALSILATNLGTAANHIQIGVYTSTATSGQEGTIYTAPTYQDGGTNSSTTAYTLYMTPTVNYTGATRTGKVYLQYLAPTLTSQPTGRNAGIAFSSAFTSSTFPAVRFFNTADEDTNVEWFEMGWHVAANQFCFYTKNAGTGAARPYQFLYPNAVATAIAIPTASTGIIDIATTSTTTAQPAGRVAIARATTINVGSGTHVDFSIATSAGGPAPTATSSLAYQGLLVNPTINYSNATPGTGYVYGIYVKPVNTALPTGRSAGISLSSTASALSSGCGIVWNNQTDEQTNFEQFTMGFTSNVMFLTSVAGGSGTVRDIQITVGNAAASAITKFVATSTIAAGVTDGYTAGIRLTPTYSAATAQTVTRHNYIDLNNPTLSGAGPAALTDAAVFRLDAALGTHKATTNTDRTANAKSGTLKVNVAGTLYYIQLYA